jgi:hypothetical protein
LQYDLQNASTLYTLQAACQRMHNIMTYLVHHAILSAYAQGAPVYTPPPAPAPVPPPQPQQAYPFGPIPGQYPAAHAPGGIPANLMRGMNLPPINQPVAEPSSQVTEVMVTPQGTKVIVPGGTTAVLPPGVHVDTAQFIPPPQRVAQPAGIPSFPPQTPGQPVEVVLPQGGGMTPEMAAALEAARSAPPPPAQPVR